MQRKIRVAVLYGGKSGEHEVSLQSAAAVIQNLDRNRFEIVPVSIDKSGRWQWNDLQLLENAKSLPIFAEAPEVRLQPQQNGKAALVSLNQAPAPLADIDVVFPIMHGPLCEDGTIQGLLELADVAYVGSGVLGSAIGMDKDVAKRLAGLAGVPVAPYLSVQKHTYLRNPSATLQAAKAVPLPVFVKPANMGSSVGVHKVKRWEDLEAALNDAFQYDLKVLIEQGVDAREIEVAVLEAQEQGELPFASTPSEVKASGGHEFYSYAAKYLDTAGAAVDLPAKLSAEQTSEAQSIARKVFLALECQGMARVDLFLDRKENKFYFNEVNTIPGFTAISMYPKMMAASGVPYQELLTRLIELALRRQTEKNQLRRNFQTE